MGKATTSVDRDKSQHCWDGKHMEDEKISALPRDAGRTHRQWVIKGFLFHKMRQRAGRRKVDNTQEA